jgi:hypothetical protein
MSLNVFLTRFYGFKRNEVKNVMSLNRDELDSFVKKMKNDGPGITPWFELIANSLLPKWWDNLNDLESLKNHLEIKRFL